MFVCLYYLLHVAGGVQTSTDMTCGVLSFLWPPAKSNSKPQEYITLFRLELLCVIEKNLFLKNFYFFLSTPQN